MQQNEFAGSAWDQERGPDARFWSAWRTWKVVDAASEEKPLLADDSDSTAETERLHSVWEQSFNAMMLVPVVTAVALSAKFAADPGLSMPLPGPAKCTYTMIGWELQRLAARELSSREPTEEEQQAWPAQAYRIFGIAGGSLV